MISKSQLQLAGSENSNNPTAPNRWVAISVLVHAVLIGFLLYSPHSILKVTQLPGDRNGHRLLLTYDPGTGAQTASLQSAHQAIKPAVHPLPSVHLPSAPPPPPTVSAPAASLTANSSSGNDALGQGDIKIASMLSHPRPSPDLSRLPAGTRGDVIVDIVIDDTGKVAKYTVQRGLGHGIDESVIATIQQWTFQPATRNGVPVASEQELLFHYERG